MGSTTCTIAFPGNPLAGQPITKLGIAGADVTEEGTNVTVSGRDWGHSSTLKFDTASTGYTTQDSWYGISSTPRTVASGTLEARRMANRLDECRQTLVNPGATTAATLSALSRRLRSGQ